MTPKYFTVAQANNSLILVRPIVRDIMLKRKKMIALKRNIRDIQHLENKDSLKEQIKTLGEKLKDISSEITYNLEELESIGCYLKDFEMGIIDFPSILDGKVIFLCWMFGEDKVESWHELTTGFEKRREITPEFTTLSLAPVKKFEQK